MTMALAWKIWISLMLLMNLNPSFSLAADGEMTPLNGEWEFYWNELLEPAHLQQGVREPRYTPVPYSWRSENQTKDSIQRYGYGTYRLILDIPASEVGKDKALYLGLIGSAYRLWIDGQEKSGLGTVGRSEAEERPQMHLNLEFFQPEDQTVELVIQVSNHSFREGGIIGEALYGDRDALISYTLKKLLFDIFIIGGLAVVGLYHLVVYAMRKNDRSALFVGFIAMAVSMRTLFLNGYLSFLLLGIQDWELLTRIEYSVEILGFLSVVFLIQSLYPQEIHRYFTKLSVVLLTAFLIYVIIAPVRLFTATMVLQSSLMTAIMVYFIFYVGILAFLRKREGALIHLIGLVIGIIAVINDTMYYLGNIRTTELLSLSIFIFIMLQAILVSYRFSRISQRNDMLVAELGRMNETLEKRVEQRTLRLKEANRQLSEMKDIRNKMLSNIAHDLGTPLVGIQTHLQLMADQKITVHHTNIVKQLLGKTTYVRRLIHDLFELSKLESKELALQFEEVEIKTWIHEIHAKFSADLVQEGFELKLSEQLSLDRAGELFVKIDQTRMLQALQNLLDNAVKFSRGCSDVITLQAQIDELDSGRVLVIEVIDYGIGMTEEEQHKGFYRFYKRREMNDTGSGLGLAIVREIVEQHQGSVGVRSQEGAGSTFFITLPVCSNPP